MQKNKKNLIVFGVFLGLIVVYSFLFNISPKKKGNDYVANCGTTKIDLDQLNICLTKSKELLANEEYIQLQGNLSQCLTELQNLNAQNMGYDIIPQQVSSDIKFKVFYQGKHSPVESVFNKLHVKLTRVDSVSSPYCNFSVLDPVLLDKTLEFIPNAENNILICLDEKGNSFIYYSSDISENKAEEILEYESIQINKIIDANKKLRSK